MKKKPLLILFLVVATELIGFGLIIPILPQIGIRLGTSPLQQGLLLAAYSAAQFLAAPLLGRLSDRYGRKPLLVWSKLGTAFSYVLFAFSRQYHLILLARLVDGFTGGNIAVARAYVADVTEPENRSKGMAVIGMAFGFGFLIGPALGGFLFTTDGSFFVPGLVAASVSFIAAFLTYALLEEPEKREPSKAGFLHFMSLSKGLFVKGVGVLLLIQCGYMIVFSGFETTFSVFTFELFDFNERQNSWMFVYAGFATLFIQGFFARFKLLADIWMVLLGFVLGAIGFGLMSISTVLSTLLLGLGIMVFGICFININMPALISTRCEKASQGVVMGLYEAIGGISRVIGPFVGSLFIAGHMRLGYHSFSVAFGVLGFFILLFSFRKPS